MRYTRRRQKRRAELTQYQKTKEDVLSLVGGLGQRDQVRLLEACLKRIHSLQS